MTKKATLESIAVAKLATVIGGYHDQPSNDDIGGAIVGKCAPPPPAPSTRPSPVWILL